MPVFCFDENRFYLPSPDVADEEGLVLIGGKVTPERIVEAYKKGIFPWYNDDSLPLWWSPDPRFILFPEELHVSRSMKKVLEKNQYEFKINTSFTDVIEKCANVERKEQDGTWITKDIKEAYTDLHYNGIAHCAEAWKENELVGGMYGIRLGEVFFGESMFSTATNASKFAFIKFVQQLQYDGIRLIDCQVYTDHVASLGARLVPRDSFLQLLEKWT